MSLWDFAVAVYARPAVAGACLRIQDELGGNVNLCLCLLWCGVHGRRAGRSGLDALVGAVATFHADVTAPLRSVRRRAAAAALRSELGLVELAAERVELGLLEERAVALPRAPHGPRLAGGNLAAYLRRLGGADRTEERALLVAATGAWCRERGTSLADSAGGRLSP